jgi:hypothetical protein
MKSLKNDPVFFRVVGIDDESSVSRLVLLVDEARAVDPNLHRVRIWLHGANAVILPCCTTIA